MILGKSARIFRRHSCLQIYHFFNQGSLYKHWQFTEHQGKGGKHVLFLSTTCAPLRTFGHVFSFFHVRLLPRCYSMRFTSLSLKRTISAIRGVEAPCIFLIILIPCKHQWNVKCKKLGGVTCEFTII